VKGVGTIKSLVTAKPGAYAKALGNLWLTYSFEAKPLMDDAHDAGEALASLMQSERHDTFPVYGKGKETSKPTYTKVPWSNYYGAAFWYYDRYDFTEAEVKYYGRCLASANGIRGSLQKFGVDVFDVLPAVWEAVPWSFFVDYFLNVQEMIDSCRYLDARPAWLNRAVRNRSVRLYGSIYGESSAPPYTQVGGSARVSTVKVFKQRDPITDMPWPSWQLRVPGVGSTRWLNVAALWASIANSAPSRPPPVHY
jgi:hypothetical protein